LLPVFLGIPARPARAYAPAQRQFMGWGVSHHRISRAKGLVSTSGFLSYATLAWVLLGVVPAKSPLRAASSISVTTPGNISKDGTGNFPQIIVDSSGNIDVAFADASSSGPCTPGRCTWTGGLKFVRSTDGGKTFSAPVVLESSGAGPLRMALESDCTIDIAYLPSDLSRVQFLSESMQQICRQTAHTRQRVNVISIIADR